MLTTIIDTDKKIENWQKMMFSCRQACKVMRLEYDEPEFLNWAAGRNYHTGLWDRVKENK